MVRPGCRWSFTGNIRLALDDFTLARVLHVVAVLFWIGGVAFVTLVVMPAIRANNTPDERLHAFRRIEASFSPQAKWWVLLAGLTGFWMIWRVDLWSRFAEIRFWWMHAMVLVWALFSIMLFIAEPLGLHRRMEQSREPATDFRRMEIAHRVLLAMSVVAVIGAVGGAHGLF